MGQEAAVGPVSLLLDFLFGQVGLVMNNVLVATSGDTFPYRAYLTTLLSYGANETWLKLLEVWATIRATMYNEQGNQGLVEHWEIKKNGKAFDLKGRLHRDMLLQEWQVPNDVNMMLLLSWSQSAFHIMEHGGKPECQVCIEEAILEVRNIEMALSEELHVEEVLTGSGAK